MSTILVTGANRGIGLEFVRQYAEAGERVIACARHPNAPLLKQISTTAKGRVSIHHLDVTDHDTVVALAAELRDQTIDILINNAGIEGEKSRGLIDYPGWVRTDMGGSNAPLSVDESVHAMRAVIERLQPENSGQFFGHRGETLPW